MAVETRRPDCRNERGVALVVALLALGVIAALAAMLANEFVIALRRSQNQLVGEQAWEYLLGAEELASVVLERDTNSSRDHLGELWAQGVQAYEIEDGWLTGQLEDLQGRFNLALLSRSATAGEPQPAVPASENERRFMRLLQAVGGADVDEARARALTEAVIDWIDPDMEETGFGGAEDSLYGRREPALRAANRVPASVSELRAVEGVDAPLFAALAPELSVWPAAGVAINVNTARPALLRSLAGVSLQPLPEPRLAELLAARSEAGFKDLQEFADNPAWDGEPPTLGLGEQSDYFLLRAEVEYRGLRWRMESVLARRNGSVRAIARSLGAL